MEESVTVPLRIMNDDPAPIQIPNAQPNYRSDLIGKADTHKTTLFFLKLVCKGSLHVGRFYHAHSNEAFTGLHFVVGFQRSMFWV